MVKDTVNRTFLLAIINNSRLQTPTLKLILQGTVSSIPRTGAKQQESLAGSIHRDFAGNPYAERDAHERASIALRRVI
jgi:hypothetical protein